MAETFSNNELYNYAQSNFKKILEVALSSEVNSKQPLDDPHILQKIQEISNDMNIPINNSYVVPQLLKDCSEGNYEQVEEHVINCCAINEIGPNGETALACAINSNNIEIVALLLKSGANPNSRLDKIKCTPLMDAANAGFTDIVRVLLEFGANPDIKSSTNNTALHYAACGGHLECCKLILEYTNNPQILIEEQNENGHTALMEAVTSGFLETTQFLVHNGAQINIPSAEFKETALTLASYKGHSDIVQFLLEAGADHDHRTDEMHTALMEASMEGHVETAKILLYYGALVSMRADSFESPLTLAACSGHVDLAAYLIIYGADIEEINDESYTPLMEASREGHLEAVAMLLSLGANINRMTEETQETAMTLAACGGFYDIVLLLQRCGADIELGASTPLMESSQECHLEIVKALLIMGAKVDAKNPNDETSLHFAAENGHVEVCRYLLDHNADIHHVSEGGRTCLMKACRAGNLDVVILLIDRGARIDQLTTIGDHNALSLACANGHCRVVEYLLQVGADITVKLKDNCSVLIEASRAGHIDVIEILLKETKRENQILNRTIDPSQQIYPIDIIGHDLSDIQQLNNHSLSPTMTNDIEDVYKMNDLLNVTDMMQFQQQQSLSKTICDFSPLTNIYTDHHLLSLNTSSFQDISLFHSCSFSSSISSDSELQIVTDVTTDSLVFVRPLLLTTDISDPLLKPPPSLLSVSNKDQIQNSFNSISLFSSLSDNDSVPASIFGTENDKLLQTMLKSNSPNLEEWVKYMYPNLNTSAEILPTMSQPKLSCATSPELFQQSPTSHLHRKIKKARHSENYNSQFDMTPNKNFLTYQKRFQSNSSVDGTTTIEVEDSNYHHFHRCQTEGFVDLDFEVKQVEKIEQSNIVSNDIDLDLKNLCSNCNLFHVVTSISSDTGNPLDNISFTSPNNSSSNDFLTLVTSSADSGIFSVDQNNANMSSASAAKLIQDDYNPGVTDILNTITPSSNSPLRLNIGNKMSSTPFQKQVLQPKRRLQQSQRSPLSNTLPLPTSSSFCTEHKMTPESFLLPSTLESTINSNDANFPEKKVFSEDKDIYSKSHNGSLVMCPITGESNNKPGLLSPSYHLERMRQNNINNCDNIPPRKSATAICKSNSTENLEIVKEIYNDDTGADCESDIEIVRSTPPYHSNSCCNNQNCKRRLNVNVCTESLQESPLSLACAGGHIEVVKLLVNSGAKLEHRDKKSQTPLHVAVLHGHLEVVRFLLESKADIEAMVDRTKDTALSIACANGKLEIIEELVCKGANIEHRNISDYTPLSLAASGGYVDVIRFLLKNNVEINSRTNSKLGISPLMLASMNGHFAAVVVLLDSGSDINAQIETNRNTALTLACFQGRTEVVSLLVERKANIEHRAKSGLSPLMEAASQGHIDVGRILIEAGADVNAPPVPASRETALIIASEKGHTEFVRLLLQHNAIVDTRNKKGDTSLWLASNGGYIDLVKILIDAKSDVNSADNRRITCLMAAFKKGHVKVVKELVQYATQFPSEYDCTKHMKSIKNEDKDLTKCCENCKEIILKAKERQEYEAAKNAKDLLKQVEEERKAKEQKEVKLAKKREKKKAKKKAKHEDRDVDMCKSEDINVEVENVSSVPEEALINPVIYPSKYTNVQSQNNNENINPDISIPAKSNKRSRTKPEPDKQKKQEPEEIKSTKSVSDAIVYSSNIDAIPVTSVDLGNTNKSTSLSTTENSCLRNNDNNNNKKKNISKNNTSWIQINSNKPPSDIQSDENPVNTNWQKIGGNKKKLDIQVNKKDIGKVIGQGGSVVNAIRQITCAHIDIDSLVNDLDERTVHLKGTLEAVTKSRDYICDLVDGNITGNMVIKESEPYLSKTNTIGKSSTDCCITTSPNNDFEYSKSIRQNGKANKFGYIKFGPNPSTVGVGNLQYGFSKSIKAPDFASVAAAGLSCKYVDKMLTNDYCISSEPLVVTTSSNIISSFSNNFVKEPLEINTNQHMAQSISSKSFPLAPGSERSLHQRTYNSTPEHSPQIDNSKHEMPPSDGTITSSNNSDKDDITDGIITPGISYSTPINASNWSYSDYSKRSFQDPSNFSSVNNEPMPTVDIESLNRFPKLYSLNPKAEAFSPSMIGNNHMYNFKPEDFYYNINGTLTLNPTANIFKPRQSFPVPSSISPIVTDTGKKPPVNINYSLQQQQPSPVSTVAPQEERLIRLQDHINMAINILLRTNGFDHNMVEAAFSSFMRSANLDLNTRLTISEFTSLINNIINQSNNNASLPQSLALPLSSPLSSSSSSSLLNHVNYAFSSINDSSSSNQCTNYRQHHQPLLVNRMSPVIAQTAQTHWPILPSLNGQSIWAPSVSANGAPLLTAAAAINSPFFPSLGQCVSAQTAFNSQPLFNLNNNNTGPSLSQQLSSMINCDQSLYQSPTLSDNTGQLSSLVIVDAGGNRGVGGRGNGIGSPVQGQPSDCTGFCFDQSHG